MSSNLLHKPTLTHSIKRSTLLSYPLCHHTVLTEVKPLNFVAFMKNSIWNYRNTFSWIQSGHPLDVPFKANKGSVYPI